MFAKMVSCAGMIERHLEGILAYWNRETTNAFLEGLNSVFSAVKRKPGVTDQPIISSTCFISPLAS
jgi:hypothetical protein